jgi:hypothetical protein
MSVVHVTCVTRSCADDRIMSAPPIIPTHRTSHAPRAPRHLLPATSEILRLEAGGGDYISVLYAQAPPLHSWLASVIPIHHEASS